MLVISKKISIILAVLSFAFIADNSAQAQTMPWSSGWKPITASINISSFKLQVNGEGRLVKGPGEGVGAWELFKIYNESNPEREPLLGDIILIQTHTGAFLDRRLNAITRNRNQAAHFMVAPVTGSFRIGSSLSTGGIKLRLVSSPNPIINGVREDGTIFNADGIYAITLKGDGQIGLSRSGTLLHLKIYKPEIVQLKSFDNGKWVSAEGGGGSTITANRSEPGKWENFRIFKIYNQNMPLSSGDVIALQTLNGKFISVEGAQNSVWTDGALLKANSNRANIESRFIVTSVSNRGNAQLISLRPNKIGQGEVVVEDGNLVWRRSSRSTGEFLLYSATHQPTAYRWLSNGNNLPDNRPFATPPTRLSKDLDVAVFALNKSGLPEWTWSDTQMRKAFIGEAGSNSFSVQSFLDANTNRAIQLNWRGVFGPVPITPSTDNQQDIINAIDNGFPALRGLTNGDRQIHSDDTAIFIMDTNTGHAQHQTVNVTSPSGLNICCKLIVTPAGDSNSPEAAVNPDLIGTAAHEISHLLWDQQDNYGYPQLLRGDVISWPDLSFLENPSDQFVIERVSGPGNLINGDQVRLKKLNGGRYLRLEPEKRLFPDAPSFPSVVNLVNEATVWPLIFWPSVWSATVFTIEVVDGSATAPVTSDTLIRLRTSDKILGVQNGEGNAVEGRNSWSNPAWSTFKLHFPSGENAVSGARVALISNGGNGKVLYAEHNGRTDLGEYETEQKISLKRGYTWSGLQGAGAGGIHDNASHHGQNLVSAFYRIKNGWANYKYLTPNDRGCYRMKPFLDNRETVILYDPQYPIEWYTVELRKRTAILDDVPSGFVVSWIATDIDYWTSVFNRKRDPKIGEHTKIYPAIISAITPGEAANQMERPLSLNPNAKLQLNSEDATFKDLNLKVALPLGDGSPSNFEVSFLYEDGDDKGTVCIH